MKNISCSKILLGNILVKPLVQVVLVWLGIILIRYYPLFFQQKALFFGDNYSLLIPGKLFTAGWLKQGIIPLWNPYILSGISWIGDISQSLFYPSTIFFIFFHPATALTLTVITHLLISMVGMYVLSFYITKHHVASLLAGILWTVSTQLTGSINNLAMLQSLSWTPLVIAGGMRMLTNKKWQYITIVFIVLQIAGGYPQHVFYSIITALLFSWVAKKNLKNTHVVIPWKTWFWLWVKIGLFSFLLSAPIILPFAQTMLHSTRIAQNAAQSVKGSMQIADLFKIIIPFLFDKPTAGMKWGPSWIGMPNASLYVTWIGLLFVYHGRSVRKTRNWYGFFVLAALASFIMALGNNIPYYQALLERVPLLKSARYPSITFIFTNISIILLIALDIAGIKKNPIRFKKNIVFFGCVILTAGLFLRFIITKDFPSFWRLTDTITFQKLSISPFHTIEKDYKIFHIVSADILLLLFFFLVSYTAICKKKYGFFLCIMAIDLIYHTNSMVFFGPKSLYSNPKLEFESTMKNPQYRVLFRNSNAPYADYSAYWEALMVRPPFSDSYVDEQEFSSLAQLLHLKNSSTPDWNMVSRIPSVQGYTTLLPKDYAYLWNRNTETNINSLDQILLSHPLLQQWAVKYYVVDTRYESTNILHKEPLVAQNKDWELYELPALSRFRYEDNSPAEFTQFQENPNAMSFTLLNSHGHTDLIIADRFEHGWFATIDEKFTTVSSLNGFRKVALPQEKALTINLFYKPRFFIAGLYLFSFGVVVLCFSLFLDYKKIV